MAKIAINGLGRVGRQVLKHLITRYPELEVVAANDITDEKTLAHLLKYDSNYGTWDIDIEGKEGAIVIGDREVKIFREKDPAALPWGTLGIDIVIESTGVFTDADKARAHITAGAKKVLISAFSMLRTRTCAEPAMLPLTSSPQRQAQARPSHWSFQT